MKQQQAREEVLGKLGDVCKFEIPEQRLSGRTRSSIGSLATVYRHLVAVKEALRLERVGEARLSSRIKRDVTGRMNESLKESTARVVALQEEFQQSLEALAGQIVAELGVEPIGAGLNNSSRGTPSHPSLAVSSVKCPNCGAPLPPPSSTYIRCNYCMTSFETSHYLDQLGATLRSTSA